MINKCVILAFFVAMVGCGSQPVKENYGDSMSMEKFKSLLEESRSKGGHTEYAKSAMNMMMEPLVSCSKMSTDSLGEVKVGLQVDGDGRVVSHAVSEKNKVSDCVLKKVINKTFPKHERDYRYLNLFLR